MTQFDRAVRARVYALLAEQVRQVDSESIARSAGWDPVEVEDALHRLADRRRLVLTPEGRVRMAHPFSGVPTEYRASIGDEWWYANCAWDALAILALLGDGSVTGPTGPLWRTQDGSVSPGGVIHLPLPARVFWDDIGFT